MEYANQPMAADNTRFDKASPKVAYCASIIDLLTATRRRNASRPESMSLRRLDYFAALLATVELHCVPTFRAFVSSDSGKSRVVKSLAVADARHHYRSYCRSCSPSATIARWTLLQARGCLPSTCTASPTA